MIPDLGEYAIEVLSGYGVTLVLLLGLIVTSLRRARVTKRLLAEYEGSQDAP